jgi:hypothetical protein
MWHHQLFSFDSNVQSTHFKNCNTLPSVYGLAMMPATLIQEGLFCVTPC